MAIIKSVCPGGPAAKAGLEKNDKILAIQGQPIKDYLDFLFYSSEPAFSMTIKKGATGIIKDIWLEPGFGNLGISLDGIIYDKLKTCHNNCIFCFVDQGHPQSRPTLCLKDDDYRFSFLQASYITLTNMEADDFKRIAQMALSPLYISVHTTNENLRVQMMRNKKATDIMKQLQSLAKEGISFHTQIVLCPGYNDALELDNTIKDLSSLGSNLLSIGVVPVGLTRFRDRLTHLKTVDGSGAGEVLKKIKAWQEKFLVQRGERVVFAADEFYWLAKVPVPHFQYYEEYPLLENGIGLTRNFREEAKEALTKFNKISSFEQESFCILTSEMGAWALQPVLLLLRKKYKYTSKVIIVKNKFFGSKVTVSGLLVGQDICEVLAKEELPKKIFIPAVMFNDDGKTIDGYSFADIQRQFPQYSIFLGSTLEDVLVAM